MQIRIITHRRLTISLNTLIAYKFRTRVCVICEYVHMHIYICTIDFMHIIDEFKSRESNTLIQIQVRTERLIRVISGITSVYPRYLWRKRSVFDTPMSGLLSPG